MFKKFMAVALVAAITVGFVGCGASSNQSAGTTDNSSASSSQTQSGSDNAADADIPGFDGTFTVGFDADFPPFGYKAEDGSYVGFDLDLAQEVCDRNGWELVRQPINWDSKDMELDAGTIDCIWNGFTYTGREDKYCWTAPYINSNIMVVVREDSDINSFSDLAGKNVCVQADSSGYYGIAGEDAAPENKELVATFANLDQVSDYAIAFQYLGAGTYDAVVVDILTGNTHMFAEGNKGKFKMLDEVLVVEQCAVGFKMGNDALKDKVESTLFEMLDDGTIEKIVGDYADSGMAMNAICLGDFR